MKLDHPGIVKKLQSVNVLVKVWIREKISYFEHYSLSKHGNDINLYLVFFNPYFLALLTFLHLYILGE